MAAYYQDFTGGYWNNNTRTVTLSSEDNRMLIIFLMMIHADAAVEATGVTVDGNPATKIDGLVSPEIEVSIALSAWKYAVPASMSGNVDVVVSGGTGNPLLEIIEIAGALGVVQSNSTSGDDANLTLVGVKESSICVDCLAADGAVTPTIDEGGTLMHSFGWNDGDDRYDCGWGLAYETGSGSVTMGWNATTSTRCYMMIEVGEELDFVGNPGTHLSDVTLGPVPNEGTFLRGARLG